MGKTFGYFILLNRIGVEEIVANTRKCLAQLKSQSSADLLLDSGIVNDSALADGSSLPSIVVSSNQAAIENTPANESEENCSGSQQTQIVVKKLAQLQSQLRKLGSSSALL